MNTELFNYAERIIAYIDILGFKEYIETTVSNGKQGELYRILFKFKDLANTSLLKRPDRNSTHFSDLIVISCLPDRLSLIDLLSDLQELAHSFIESKLLLRGVIIKGEIVHQNGIIFGPALIDAYLIEKDKVIFPRIIIDKEIVREFKLEEATKSYFTKERILTIDPFDNEYFINYFQKYIEPNTDVKNTLNGYYYNYRWNIVNNGTKVNYVVKNRNRYIIENFRGWSNWHKQYPLDLIANVENLLESSDSQNGVFVETFWNIINNGLKNSNARVKEKYKWMLNWHNHYLQNWIADIENNFKLSDSLQQKIDLLKFRFNM